MSGVCADTGVYIFGFFFLVKNVAAAFRNSVDGGDVSKRGWRLLFNMNFSHFICEVVASNAEWYADASLAISG